MKSPWLHPLIFALLPIWHLYAVNRNETWPSIMLLPSFVALIFGGGSWWFWQQVIGNKHRASIMTSLWLIAFYAYGHVYLAVTAQEWVMALPVGPHAWLLSTYFLMLWGWFYWLRRLRTNLNVATQLLTMVGVVLVVMNIGPLIPFEIERLIAWQKLHNYQSTQALPLVKQPLVKTGQAPDIYYFIFDRYPRFDILADYFNYQNDTFVKNLRDRGFFVAEQSVANYANTFQSLSSSLNMSHLDFLEVVLGSDYTDQAVVNRELIEHNFLVKQLKAWGYYYLSAGDSWPPTQSSNWANAQANVFYKYDQFSLFLYENTLANAVIGKVNGKPKSTGETILYKTQQNLPYRLDRIKRVADQVDQPVFVFGHFLLPHPPYLVAASCEPLTLDQVRQREEIQAFLDQVACADKLMVDLAQNLVSKSSRPVVVIFQSDEGPYLPETYFDGTRYVETPNHEAYLIHGSILTAIYASLADDPENAADYEDMGITNDITPVNIFRVILNYYFPTNYPMLPNTSFLMEDQEQPYRFREITEIMQAAR